MDWNSQDDVEGECAATQMVPASQELADDAAPEESALEFNAAPSQNAWGDAPTQLVPASQACDLAEDAAVPASQACDLAEDAPPEDSALEFNAEPSQDAWGAAPESLDAWSAPLTPPGSSPARKAPSPIAVQSPKVLKAPSPVSVQSPKVAKATEPSDDELRGWVARRVARCDDLQTVTMKTITNDLKAAFGGIKVKGARKKLVKAAIIEELAARQAREDAESDEEVELPINEARRLGFDDLVEDEDEEAAPAEDEATEQRPMNPYLYFSKLKRSEVRAAVDADAAFADVDKGTKNKETTKRLGALWKELDEDSKQRYKDDAPLTTHKKRKSSSKKRKVIEEEIVDFDPEAHAAEYALLTSEEKPSEELPAEVAETKEQIKAEQKRAEIEEAIEAEEASAEAEASAKRDALAARIQSNFDEDRQREELAARATLARLLKEASSDDDDSDVELEIVGAPSPAKKARRASLSPSKTSTAQALKKARTQRAGGRRALRDKLRTKAARAGMVKYAEQASVEAVDADDYVARLEFQDAQRVVEQRDAERRDKEERELEAKLRATGARYAELDAREEEVFAPDADDALALDRAAAQDAIQACLEAQCRAEESPEDAAWPADLPAASATVLAEDLPASATALAEDFVAAPAEDLPAAPAVSEDLAAPAADGVTDAQAAEDLAPAAETGPSAAAGAEEDAPADAEEEEAAPRIEDMEIDKEPVEKKDRNAAYKAILEADAQQAKKKSHAGIEGEAEESDEDDGGQMGLGDFGFGVAKPKAKKDEDQEDLKITEDDLEAVVDELSDGEGDEAGAEAQRAKEARKREREEMAQMLRKVRDGFGGQDARGGAFRIDDLVGMDASARKEAKRLGLEDSDDEEIRKLRAGSDDEEEDNEDQEVDEEQGLAALISQQIKDRHLGDRLRRKEEPLISDSDSESEDEEVKKAGSDSEEDEAAIKVKSRQWARRAKMRRVLEEKSAREKAERAERGENSQGASALFDADEDSQLILSMLSRTQSSRSATSVRSDPFSQSQPSSLERASSLIRSASDSQTAWLPAAKKPRLGAGVSAAAEDALLGRCGTFFAALDRQDSAGAPSAKSHANKAAKTSVSISSLFGGDSNSQFGGSRFSGKAASSGPVGPIFAAIKQR